MQTNLTLCVMPKREVSDDQLDITTAVEEEDHLGLLGLFASVLLLVVCVTSNIQCIRTVRRGKIISMHGQYHGCGNNVIDLVTVICAVSLINGSSTCASQMVSFIIGKWTFGHHVCKAHGFFSNLMSLLVVWYTTLLGVERYFKFVNPAEHNVTFSKINCQLIIFGITTIMLSVVSGPIYGWGDYVYIHGTRTCTFDVKSPNAMTYYIMTSTIYLMFPYIMMACCCVIVSFSRGGHAMPRPSVDHSPSPSGGLEDIKHLPDHYDSKRFIYPFTMSVVLSFLLQLPTHMTSIGQLMRPDWTCSSGLLFTAAWLQIFATNCCLSSSVLACNIRCKPCFSSDLMSCSPWWRKIPSTTDISSDQETAVKSKNASYTCKLCLHFHIIHGQ